MSTVEIVSDSRFATENGSTVSSVAGVPAVNCGDDASWLTKTARRAVLRNLSQVQGGQILLDDECRRIVLGSGSADNLYATVQINHSAFFRKTALGGSLGAAESYLNGDWDCDDLPTLFRILSRNLNRFPARGRLHQILARAAARGRHLLARNTRHGSRRNIHAHYDLGNDFFELFLDPSMMYSAAVYERPDMTLEEAQTARLDRVCQSLELTPSDHVAEIGTGWGGFACFAASRYGCRVTTTTISQNQYDYSVRRIREAGLSDRVTVLKQDYRDLQGRFDKLVSLEMIEAVGRRYYDTYFRKCAELLKPEGRMLLQAIVMPEQRYRSYLKSVDFIQKYIFPGGCLPSVRAMADAVSRTSDRRLLELTDFADGYMRTLREWRRRFHQRLDEVRGLGCSDRFIRMWDYYLAYCEGAFHEKAVGVVHAVWGR